MEMSGGNDLEVVRPNFYEQGIVEDIYMEPGQWAGWGYGAIKRNYGRLKTSPPHLYIYTLVMCDLLKSCQLKNLLEDELKFLKARTKETSIDA